MPSPHRKLVAALAKRRLKADYHSARLGGSLASLVDARRAALLASLPDRPHPLDAYRLADHAAATAWRLRVALRQRLSAGLGQLAGLSHAHAARLLTQRVRGTLPVRAVGHPATRSESLLGVNRGSLRVSRSPLRVVEAWTDYLDDYDAWVIDPPTADLIARLVGPAPDLLTRLIDPQQASRVVLDGIAAGRDRRRIAADLADVFGGYENVARRVARSEGVRVATESQLAASESIPGLVAGYQVHCVHLPTSRKEHTARDKTVYHRHPRSGQPSLQDCPRPPMDPDGSGGYRIAYGCLCFLTPVFGSEAPEDLAAEVDWSAAG